MYNIYSEEKKQTQLEKRIKEQKDSLINSKKHRNKTKNLALNYQKRIKKFIIDVSKPKFLLYNI